MIFHQLFEPETCTFTYILADAESKEAIIIDPVLETVERDMQLLKSLELKLVYILDTHLHADHVTGSGEMRKRTGAKIALGLANQIPDVDLPLEDGQILRFGSHSVKVLSTPGHTNGCVSYLVEDKLFTGDALMINGCGRTDFQSGSSEALFYSVRDKLFALPDSTMVYPAHDYKGFTHSTIREEKNHNPRLNLQVNLDEFKTIMNNLKLDYPKRIDVALPLNRHCGLKI